jgi:hypothetical protein
MGAQIQAELKKESPSIVQGVAIQDGGAPPGTEVMER